jgi:hypothetical protein
VPTITIDHRFCGPAQSGHGGYSSGVLAAFLDTPATVTLSAPPPLDRPLDVVTMYYGGVELRDGEVLIGTAERRAPLAVDERDPITFEQAEQCEDGFVWAGRHPFPMCFASGTDRARGDGWRIMAGETPDGDAVASRAICPPDLAAADGTIPDEQIWAALDCVTSHPLAMAGAELSPPWVLGRLAVDILGRIKADDELVVMAWPDDLDGRKFHSEGALYCGDNIVAVASATWIQLRDIPAP